MLSISSSRFCNSVCLSVKRTDERGSLGDDCLIALQHNPPQLLHRRRREAYFWSYPRMPGEYSTLRKILQVKYPGRDCSISGKTGKIGRRENPKEEDPCVYGLC